MIRAEGQSVQEIATSNRHETGHHVWYQILNDSLREEFEEISLYYRERSDLYCINGYENTTKEDFADSYRYFISRDIIVFDTCRDKLEFFKKVNKLILEDNKRIVIG